VIAAAFAFSFLAFLAFLAPSAAAATSSPLFASPLSDPSFVSATHVAGHCGVGNTEHG